MCGSMADVRPHRRRTQTFQSYSPGCVHVTLSSTLQSAYAPYRCYPLPSRFEYIDRRTCSGMSWAGHFLLQKLPLCARGSTPQSNTWFLWLIRVNIANGIAIGSAVFGGLTVVTDRQTDRPRYSVRSNRPHLAIVLRCGLVM